MENPKPNVKLPESNPGWILLPEQMDILRKVPYTYNASAGSFLELLFLQRFWTALVRFIPLRLAPCVLTCFGLGINLFCCLTLLYYTPDVESDAPSWTFVLCAIGVFLYQTLDALDGKQAIKVQNTQIEELYDHGCDAISTVFVGLAAAAACKLAECPFFMFAFFLASVLAFYSTHWQDHVTHVMIFGKIDVSEAQFSVIGIHLVTAYFGQSIWTTEFFGIEMRQALVVCSIITLSRVIFINIGYILGNKTPLDEFAEIPRKSGSQIWNPLVPVAVLAMFAARAYGAGLFALSPCIFIIAFGFGFAKITMKLVVTNVTSADMDYWDSSLVAPLLLFLNTFLGILPAHTSLLCGLVYNLMDLARYFTYVSWDFREALDAWIFSLKYMPGHPNCQNGNNGFYMNGLNNKDIKDSARKSKMLPQTK